MHHLRIIILLAVGVVSACAQDALPKKYGFRRYPEEIFLPTTNYSLTFLRAEPDKDHGSMGFFAFKHASDKPIQMWGFGFESDGSFRVRFERFAKLQDSKWQEVFVGYCATGAETYPIEPNHDYVLRVPLWPYTASGTRGVILLSGKRYSVISDEFDTATVRKNTDKRKLPNDSSPKSQ